MKPIQKPLSRSGENPNKEETMSDDCKSDCLEHQTCRANNLRVIRVGWFAFEGFGRPYEGWRQQERGWRVAGRAFTRHGALRKAEKLPALAIDPRVTGENVGRSS